MRLLLEVDHIKTAHKLDETVTVVESHYPSYKDDGELNYCKGEPIGNDLDAICNHCSSSDPSELVKRYNRKSRSMFEVENVDEGGIFTKHVYLVLIIYT